MKNLGMQRGFSIVEIMVGLVIALLATIVIFQVFAASEGYKRTTTSGSDAQQNGALALFSIERDVRQAGYGLTTATQFLGCNIENWDEQRVPPGPFTLEFIPVRIAQGAGTAPDQITLNFGDNELLAAPATITQDMPTPASTYKVDNRFGFGEGDLIIVAETGKPCTLAQVTEVPGTPGNSDNIIHNSGNYTDPETGENVPARYNKPGGLSTAYTKDNGKVFNIGKLPTSNVYSINNNQLVFRNELLTDINTPLIDGIVQLQAQYGADDGSGGGTPDDGIVDGWTETSPTTPGGWQRILAVRLAMASRSALKERGDPTTGACSITTAAPTWSGGTLNLSADPDWQCYRYKTHETTVPVRNMIWRPES